MRTARLLRTLSAVSAALLLGGLAQARTTFTAVQTGFWDVASTWDQNAVPAAGDSVVINNTGGGGPYIVTLRDARPITGVTVGSNGQLKLDGDGTNPDPTGHLTFQANASSPSMSIAPANGFQMVDNAKVTVEQTMSFTGVTAGTSSLQAQDDASCTIEIGNAGAASSVTLSLDDLIVHGELQFVGVGTGSHTDALYNYLIDSDSGGAITLASSLESITDLNGGVRWSVGGAGSLLIFDEAATGLAGNFNVGASGVLRCNQNVTTTGTFSIACPGAVDVNSATFDYASVGSENCTPDPNPSAISTDFNCRP